MSGEQRFNQVWNGLLFFCGTVAIVSGFGISRYVAPALGIRGREDPFWHGLHESSVNGLMVMVGVHLAMHVRQLFRRSVPRAAE